MNTEMGPLTQALFFLVDFAFSLFILSILLRVILQIVRADFYNPFCQFLIKLTNPVIIPMRRFIPGYGGIDWAGVVVLFLFAFAKQAVLILIQTKMLANGVGLLLLASADILRQLFYIYFFATLALVAASWINPRSKNPMLQIVHQILLKPFKIIRQYIPDVAGFDLSPMIFMVVLILLNILIIQVIFGMGYNLILNN